MASSYDPSKYHEVTWRASGTEAGPVPREKLQAAGVHGPWFVGGWLFCFADPEYWAYPGGNIFTIDLSGLNLGTPWTVTADVTELLPPATPHIGDATFIPNGVTLNQPEQLAFVYFDLEWGSSLPVAIMMNIGCTAHPLLPANWSRLR
jgi:hypothetical protein